MSHQDPDNFRRDVIWSIGQSDAYAGEMLHQIVALEAIVVARWPRSVLLRRQLRRELRRSVAHIEGRTFAEKRLETIGTGWLVPPWRTAANAPLRKSPAERYEAAFRAMCEDSIERNQAESDEEPPSHLNNAVLETERDVPRWRRALIDRRVLRELDYWNRSGER